MKIEYLFVVLILFMVVVHVKHLNYTRVDILVSKVKHLAESGKPLLIKINSYPSSGKTTFIRANKKNTKLKLMDTDDYNYKFNDSSLLLDKSNQYPGKHLVLFGKWEKPKYEESVIYVSVVPPFHTMVHNMYSRMFSNHKTNWLPHENYIDRQITVHNSHVYGLPIMNDFGDTLDFIYKTYKRHIHTNVLNAYFDKIYCICVPDRKERMKNIFRRWGLVVELYDAYLIKDMNKEALQQEGFLDPNCTLKDGEICCAYSHHQVHKKFYNNSEPDDTVFIFEDDLDEGPATLDEFNNMMMPYIDNIPDEWDYINFGACYEQCKSDLKNKYYQTSTDPKCLQAVGFNKTSLKHIIAASTPLSNEPCDVQIANLTLEKAFKAFSTHATVFGQNKTEVKTLLGNNFTMRCSIGG
jgi:hypothetical protein